MINSGFHKNFLKLYDFELYNAFRMKEIFMLLSFDIFLFKPVISICTKNWKYTLIKLLQKNFDINFMIWVSKYSNSYPLTNCISSALWIRVWRWIQVYIGYGRAIRQCKTPEDLLYQMLFFHIFCFFSIGSTHCHVESNLRAWWRVYFRHAHHFATLIALQSLPLNFKFFEKILIFLLIKMTN